MCCPPKRTPCAALLVTGSPFSFVSMRTDHFEFWRAGWRWVRDRKSVCPGAYPFAALRLPARAAPVSHALSLATPAGASGPGSEPPCFIPADPCTTPARGRGKCTSCEHAARSSGCYSPADRCLHFLLTAHSRMRAGRLVGVSSTQCVRWRDHHARAPASAARGGAGADLRGGGQNRGRRSEAASAAVTGDATGGRRCGAVARAGAGMEVPSERTGAPGTAARRC